MKHSKIKQIYEFFNHSALDITVKSYNMKKITTLYQLADYINDNNDWQLVVEDIIEQNGWHSDCGDTYGVCHDDNNNKVVINEQGNAEVI